MKYIRPVWILTELELKRSMDKVWAHKSEKWGVSGYKETWLEKCVEQTVTAKSGLTRISNLVQSGIFSGAYIFKVFETL